MCVGDAGWSSVSAAWDIRRGGELCLCVTAAMSQPPGASGTAELTGPECSPAPAPWVSTVPRGLWSKPPLEPASAEERVGQPFPGLRSLPTPLRPPPLAHPHFPFPEEPG